MLSKSTLQKAGLALGLLSTSLSLLYLGIAYYTYETVKSVPIPAISDEEIPEPFFYNKIGQFDGMEEEDSAKSLPTPAQFTVELRKSPHLKEAQSLVKRLSKQGVDAYYTPMKDGSTIYYHVMSGVFPTRDLAMQQADFLKQELDLSGSVQRL